MELLIFIGSFLLYAVIKILITLGYAIICGCGLAVGFQIIKHITSKKNRDYIKDLEEEVIKDATPA